MRLQQLFVTFLVTTIIKLVAGAEVLRPRGVTLQKKIFYDPRKDFSCIDGSGTLPFKFVNDDYCDCADGSDEPGTSACANGVFNCANVGHIEKNIPSSRVNDGLCDCCDGTDEHNSSTQCKNNCMELGAAAREEQARLLDLLKKGSGVRNQYVQQAASRRVEDKQRLEQLKKDLADAETIKNAKDAIKRDAEDREKAALDKWREKEDIDKQEREENELARAAEEDRRMAEIAFKELDADKDGILKYYELQIRPKLDKDGDGYVSEDEAKFFLHAKEEMTLDEFIETGWIITKPYYLRGKNKPAASELGEQPPGEGVEEQNQPIDPELEADSHEVLEEAGDDDLPTPDALPDNNEPEQGDADHPEDDEDDEEEGKPYFPTDQNDFTTPAPIETKHEYDDETKAIVEAAKAAKDEFKQAENHYLDINSKAREIETSLETDYGADDVFMALAGQCFEYTDREYTYKLCPFDRASQRGKDGGGDVSLGRWGKWSGPAENKYASMKFEGGATCWNGPARSVDVTLRCGLENQVTGASEPSRCEYALDFETPALCVVRSFGLENDVHDEL